ncbi:SMI1/KNR4 family protein [uncultured Erythrobacter sp.]|uniref:SMI1/KNR4 family protein n=1 Tax=uncultured Erythrobacter sp. TaxID=263913 RepID=UPI002630C1C3|nr:SMI1/KNR4 family protein [uncultured Erythrobacter sp.]
MLENFIKKRTPFTEEGLKKIEKICSFDLPLDYKEFVKIHGNAFVGGVLDDQDGEPIDGFYSADQILRSLELDPGYKKSKAIPIADTALGNYWALADDGSVYYENYYEKPFSSTKVASSFSEFTSRIVEESWDDE